MREQLIYNKDKNVKQNVKIFYFIFYSFENL